VTSQDPAELRGPALRDRLYAARDAVRQTLLARPSIALRDRIAQADIAIAAAMREAIGTYESLVAEHSPPPDRPPVRARACTIDEPGAVGLPPPRALPSARPVTTT
jgi:hypothetical protein